MDGVENIKTKIKQVLDAEEQADGIIQSAQKEKGRILAEARQHVRDAHTASIQEAEAEIKRLQDRSQQETQKESDAIRQQAQSEIDKLQSIGRKNISTAVAYVTKSLIDMSPTNHGN